MRYSRPRSCAPPVDPAMYVAAAVQTNERLVPAVTARWEEWHLRRGGYPRKDDQHSVEPRHSAHTSGVTGLPGAAV